MGRSKVTTRRSLKKVYQDLQDRYYRLLIEHESLKLANQELQRQLTNLTIERDNWRAKHELVLHTPEYKLEAEEAFGRGLAHARKQMAVWLSEAAKEMSKND